MALDARYQTAPALEQLFTDKDTGEFLRNGYVLFFKDNARTVGKPVYKLTGTPPNYSYIAYGYETDDGAWRVDLNEQGAFSDTVYYYPYDEDGNDELYFIQVYSADDIFQFSRYAVPNFVNTATTTLIETNYIPNGQFLLHNDIAADLPTYEAGEIRESITEIAQGGWTFERPDASTAKDFVLFDRFGSAITNPTGNPRYAVRIECETASPGDSYKDLRLKFDDVNKFASSTDEYTFGFEAQVNAGSALNAELILIKNFGTGGSPPTETVLTTFTITNSYTQFKYAFSFGVNNGKTIGSGDDDYLQLALRFPVDSLFDVSLTDFILPPGNVVNADFPATTDSEFVVNSLYPPVPNPDGSDIGLSPILTRAGYDFDRSIVGKIFPTMALTAGFGELLLDGSQYEYAGYSDDGIPYSRLGDILWVPELGIYRWGTGIDYVTAYPTPSVGSNLRITTNKPGAVSAPTNGTPSPGFTFTSIKAGETAPAYQVTSVYYGEDDYFQIINNIAASAAPPTAGTSGFTVSLFRTGDSSGGVEQIVGVQTIAALGLAGKYFTFSNAAVDYYPWFRVDGAGADPTPGGTGIRIDLLSTHTAGEVAQIISEALNGFDLTTVEMVAASSIPAGSYWNLNTVDDEFYVWYEKDGAGADPAPDGKKPIKVSITSSNTAAEVSDLTLFAVNRKYYNIINANNVFFRAWSANSNFIPTNSDFRFTYNSVVFGNQIGTIQLDEVIGHKHTPNDPYTNANTVPVRNDSFDIDVISGVTGTPAGLYGDSETRPYNMYVNYVIKY